MIKFSFLRFILSFFLALTIGTIQGQEILTSSNLPILVIDTNQEEIPDAPKIFAEFGIIYNGENQINNLTDPWNEYNGQIGIEVRGSTSSILFPKIGYGFETRNEDGSNNNVSILGMPEENDWVLHGPYSDKTLMRNALAYLFGRDIMPYAPRVRFVELVINQDYKGVYLLTEKIKRDKDRVDISKLNPEDIEGDQLTGGYIIKLDKSTGNSFGWESEFNFEDDNFGPNYLYHYPKFRDISQEQIEYIQNYIKDFESLMDSPNFENENNGYPSIIDIDSWVDFLLVNEISRNVDAYRISTFFFKDRDSIDHRLKIGPVWDFNIALGNANYCDGDSFVGWSYNFNDICPWDMYKIPFYWKKLTEDNNFKLKIKSRWQDLRNTIWTDEFIENRIDSLSSILADAQERNFERWPDALGEYVWPNNIVWDTYDEEVDYLSRWVISRAQWMDSEIGKSNPTNEPMNINENYIAFPNPSKDIISFRMPPNQNGFIELFIYNSLGQTLVSNIYRITGNEQVRTEIDISKFAVGTYYFKFLIKKELVGSGVFQRKPD